MIRYFRRYTPNRLWAYDTSTHTAWWVNDATLAFTAKSNLTLVDADLKREVFPTPPHDPILDAPEGL